MWKTLNTLLNKNQPTKEEIEKIPSFIMIKWLSNNPLTVIPANIININHQIPVNLQYRFLDDYFELTGIKKRVNRIYYNKNEIKETKILKNISRYYNINLLTAKEYFELMTEQEKNDFETLYDEGKI